MRPIPVDLDELAMGLNHHDPYSEGTWYLDLRNGRVLYWTEEIAADLGEEFTNIDEPPEMFLWIEPVSSRDGYRDMRSFVDDLPDGEPARALSRALNRPKPFANFRDILHGFPDLKDRWHLFCQMRDRDKARAFLEDNKVNWKDASHPMRALELLDAPEEMHFKLDPRLKQGGFELGTLHGCHVLLKNNSLFPWLIIVPQVDEQVEDLHQLDDRRYQEVMQAIREVSEFVVEHSEPDKLNIGCIGNQVRQMHIHIVGRSPEDAAWPGTVWAHDATEPYSPDEVEAMQAAWTSRF